MLGWGLWVVLLQEPQRGQDSGLSLAALLEHLGPEDTTACQHGHTEAAAGTAALWAALRTIPSSPPQLRGSIQPHRHRLPMGGLCGLSFFGCQLLNRAQSARVWCRSKLQVPTVPPRACKVGPSQPRKGLQVLGTKKKARCPPHPLCCPQHAPGPWPNSATAG